MATFSIKVDVSQAKRKIRAYRRSVPDVVDGAMRAWGKETARELRATPYPPRTPDQRYVRTGQLASRWGSKRTKKNRRIVEVTVFNRARNPGRGHGYSSYVVGNEQGEQAGQHRGRWWTARKKVEERIPRLRNIIKAALRRKAKELGL